MSPGALAADVFHTVERGRAGASVALADGGGQNVDSLSARASQVSKNQNHQSDFGFIIVSKSCQLFILKVTQIND